MRRGEIAAQTSPIHMTLESSVLYLKANACSALKRNAIRRELWLSGRTLAQHGQGPGFSPQCCKKWCRKLGNTHQPHPERKVQRGPKAARTFGTAGPAVRAVSEPGVEGPGLQPPLLPSPQLRTTCHHILVTVALPGPISTSLVPGLDTESAWP